LIHFYKRKDNLHFWVIKIRDQNAIMAKTEDLDLVLEEFQDIADSFKNNPKTRGLLLNNNNKNSINNKNMKSSEKGVPPPPERSPESARVVQLVKKNMINKTAGIVKEEKPKSPGGSAVEQLDNLITDMETFSEKKFRPDVSRNVPITRQIDIQMEADLEELTRKMLLGMEGELQEEPDSLGLCLKCDRNIEAEAVMAGKDTYHQDCFTCTHCGIRLDGKYFIVDGEFFCEKHRTVPLDSCTQCGDFITEGAIVTNNKKYHPACFKCSICKMPLDGKFFTTKDGENICENDYKNSRDKCSHCNLPMLDKILTAMEKKFHPSCFRCALCDCALDGVPYIMDGKAINCKDCYARYKAKQCHVCNEGIVSSGDTKTTLITCEGRDYHEQCYNCSGCATSLTGEYCYTASNALYCTACHSKSRN